MAQQGEISLSKGRTAAATLAAAFMAAANAHAVGGAALLDVKEDVPVETRSFREWTFPAVDLAKGRVVVEFRNRIDYPRAAGWCPCWQIVVNGKILTASATRSETRLLNKPFHCAAIVKK